MTFQQGNSRIADPALQHSVAFRWTDERPYPLLNLVDSGVSKASIGGGIPAEGSVAPEINRKCESRNSSMPVHNMPQNDTGQYGSHLLKRNQARCYRDCCDLDHSTKSEPSHLLVKIAAIAEIVDILWPPSPMVRLTALSPDNAGWKLDLNWFEAQIAELSH